VALVGAGSSSAGPMVVLGVARRPSMGGELDAITATFGMSGS